VSASDVSASDVSAAGAMTRRDDCGRRRVSRGHVSRRRAGCHHRSHPCRQDSRYHILGTIGVNPTYGDVCSDACLPERSLACVPGCPPVRSATASDARLPPRVLALRRKTLCRKTVCRKTVFQNDLSSEQRLSGTASFFCSGHASAWDMQAIGL
jgi:hypothetical protein